MIINEIEHRFHVALQMGSNTKNYKKYTSEAVLLQ